MNLHLNWDGNQNNGVIFNDIYPAGAMFTGVEYKPDLGFDYIDFNYSEKFNLIDNIKLLDGTTRLLTDSEKAFIVQMATDWVQPLGQEGNPTLEQYREKAIRQCKQSYKELSEVPVTVNSVEWRGGDSSASAINGAVELAKALGETVVTLWDYQNINRPNISFEDAQLIAAQIAVAWRTVLYQRNEKLALINEATTISGINSILEG